MLDKEFQIYGATRLKNINVYINFIYDCWKMHMTQNSIG